MDKESVEVQQTGSANPKSFINNDNGSDFGKTCPSRKLSVPNGKKASSDPNSDPNFKRPSTSISNSKRSVKDNPYMGRYRVVRTLGRGNFAKVKLAVHMTTDCEVAVKVIDKTQLNEPGLKKLFREVKVMKTLSHPNIVQLYEVIESERHVYLVMECAQKGELFEHLVSYGRMREKDARVKFRQIVSALQYCHSKKIVHRDLKAENLLLDSKFDMKIADFGFSNFYGQGKKLDTFCGSPPYAAPELFQGKNYTGPEVDVWSLGVILYTLVSGSLPFDAKDLKDLREKVLRGKYRIPFYLTTDCEQLLKKMLVLSPEKRESLESIMNDKWMNIGFETEPLRPYVEPHSDFRDPVRIKIMIEMGFTDADIKMSLDNDKFNNIHATYQLLRDPDVRSRVLTNLSNVDGKNSVANGAPPAKKPNLDPERKTSMVVLEQQEAEESEGTDVSRKATKAVTEAGLNEPERPGPLASWLKTSVSAGPTSGAQPSPKREKLDPDSSAGVSTGASRDSFNGSTLQPDCRFSEKRSVIIDVAKEGAEASTASHMKSKPLSRNYTFSAAERARHVHNFAQMEEPNPLHRADNLHLLPQGGPTDEPQTRLSSKYARTSIADAAIKEEDTLESNRDDTEISRMRSTTIGVAAGRKKRDMLCKDQDALYSESDRQPSDESSHHEQSDLQCLLSSHELPIKVNHRAEEIGPLNKIIGSFKMMSRRLSNAPSPEVYTANRPSGAPEVATRLANSMKKVSLVEEMEPHLEKLSSASNKRPPLDPDASPWTHRQDPDDLLTPTNPIAPSFQMESSGSTPVSAAATPKANAPDTSFGVQRKPDSPDCDPDSHSSDRRGQPLPRSYQTHQVNRRKQNLFSACMNMGLTSGSSYHSRNGDGASLRDCPMVMKASLVHRDPEHLIGVCEELLRQQNIVYSKEKDPPQLSCRAVLNVDAAIRQKTYLAEQEDTDLDEVTWIITLCKIRFRNNFGLTFKVVTGNKSKFETFKGAFISQMRNSLSRSATQ